MVLVIENNFAKSGFLETRKYMQCESIDIGCDSQLWAVGASYPILSESFRSSFMRFFVLSRRFLDEDVNSAVRRSSRNFLTRQRFVQLTHVKREITTVGIMQC